MPTLKFWHILLIFPIVQSEATLLNEQQVNEELLGAGWILHGTTLDSDTQTDGKYDVRFEVKVRVDLIEKNNTLSPLNVGDEIFIEGLGGERNGIGVVYEGYPRPKKLNTYRFHLKKDGSTFKIAGNGAGMQLVRGTRQFSRNRTDGVNGSGVGPFIQWSERNFPVSYNISSVTFKNHSQYLTAIDESFRTWRDVMKTRVEFLPQGCSKLMKSQNDGLNSVVFISENWPFDTSVIALTRTYYVSSESPNEGEILDADILLNGVNHGFTVTGETGKHDIQNVMTHEIGHLLGFGHEITPIDTGATMFAFASPGETNKRVLHTSELNGLIDAYGGSGNKLGFTGPFCQIPASSASCLATHAPVGKERMWLFLAFVMAMIFAPIAMKRYWF